MIAPHLRFYVIKKGNEWSSYFMQGLLFIGISFGIVAVSGPTWKQIEVPGQDLETPLVIILELSNSMLEGDLQPSRLERAKFKITDFLKEDPRARAALIGYSGTAHTIMPLTKDYKLILSHIDGLSPSIMPVEGSDFQAALALSDTLTSITSAPGTVLLLTDDISEAFFDAVQEFQNNSKNTVEILPIFSGTEIGTEQILEKLQNLQSVNVNRLTLDNSDVEAVAQRISKNLIFSEQDEVQEEQWQDMGLLFLIPLAVIVLFWFRRGWVIYVFLVFVITSCGEINSFGDLWYSPDYQGQLLSDKNEFVLAAEAFSDPMRKGVAFFKAGDFENAIEAFQSDTTSNGAYNLGLAYFQNGDYAAANLAFGKALEIDPEMEQARSAQTEINQLIPGESEVSPEEAEEATSKPSGDGNVENQDMEDLGGGGQEATEEQMSDGRKEEEVATDTRIGKELDEVPDDLGIRIEDQGGKVLMRKVDDDPALFLQKKFAYQVKQGQVKGRNNE
ncbi:VWA domain-containing protein [Algoriphagus sediminis]|uniref:VWA domain-containing protein n=1 Tax=Algoriphagus sediminis TaxID=3057113 RepID=A0ABT7YBU8_9BACT|nr:VWA domain-containing protein [Algoriphagus sediminis]MDN3204005.1 VWA domain-containing protein [Algoriphagus sediminis]